MKLRAVITALLTVLLLLGLTLLAMQITLMPVNDQYEKVDPAHIPSSLQQMITGIVFLMAVAGLNLYGYFRKKLSVLLGISAFYILPCFGYFFGENYFDAVGEELIWYPYYEMLSYCQSGIPVFCMSLWFIPLILAGIRWVQTKQQSETPSKGIKRPEHQ